MVLREAKDGIPQSEGWPAEDSRRQAAGLRRRSPRLGGDRWQIRQEQGIDSRGEEWFRYNWVFRSCRKGRREVCSLRCSGRPRNQQKYRRAKGAVSAPHVRRVGLALRRAPRGRGEASLE